MKILPADVILAIWREAHGAATMPVSESDAYYIKLNFDASLASVAGISHNQSTPHLAIASRLSLLGE